MRDRTPLIAPASVVLISFVVVATTPGPVRAQWGGDGISISGISCCEPFDQPALISDGIGGSFVAYVDEYWTQHFTYIDVRHLDSQGNPDPTWNSTALAACGAGGGCAAMAPDLVRTSDGQMIVVFTNEVDQCSGSTCSFVRRDLYARRLVSGVADGSFGTPLVATGFSSTGPSVTDGAGGVFIPHDLAVSHLNASGQAVWAAAGIPPVPAQDQTPKLVSDMSSGVFALCVDTPSPTPLVAQHLLADGTRAPGWPAAGLVVSSGSRVSPDIAPISDGVGGLFVAWSDVVTGHQAQIKIQHLDDNGSPSAGWPVNGITICPLVTSQNRPRIAPDGFGGALVVWMDGRNATSDVYAQRVSSSGQRIWGSGGLRLGADTQNFYDSNPLYDLRVTPDGAGGGFYAWMAWSGSTNPGWEVMVHHVMPTGVLDAGFPTNGRVMTPNPGTQGWPRIAATGPAAAVAVWESYGEGLPDVRVQSVTADIPTPVEATLINISAQTDRVALEWSIATPDAAASLDRNDGTGWRRLASLTADGTGLVDYVDREVVSGATYDYRLQLAGQTSDQGLTVRVTVPRALGFGIDQVWPNPSSREVIAGYRLDGPASAWLEMLDVSGRSVSKTRVESAVSGIGSVRFDLGRFSPGLYFVRLTQGRQVATRRLTVVR